MSGTANQLVRFLLDSGAYDADAPVEVQVRGRQRAQEWSIDLVGGRVVIFVAPVGATKAESPTGTGT